MMNTFDVQLPRNDSRDRRDGDQLQYHARGRRAVQDWLEARVRGADPGAEVRTALRLGLVPRKMVRFWALEDLFADPALELEARAGYPDLADAFAELDAARRQAATFEQEQHAERDLRRALARTGH